MDTTELDRVAALAFLERDGGKVPCSRYGTDSESCAPVAYAATVIVAGETGGAVNEETLDYMMGLVVNNHDDPAYLIRHYGVEYGFDPDAYLEPGEGGRGEND